MTVPHRTMFTAVVAAFASDLAGDVVAGLVALVLILSDVYLTIHGTVDSGLQGAVPVIVAFYFGGRVSQVSARNPARAPYRSTDVASPPSNGEATP